MGNLTGAKRLRESIRVLERKLGMVNELQCSCCGISFAQCHTIVEIGRIGNSSLNDLSDLMELDKSTMSRTINNLVADGYVLREPDADDRRYLKIRLTEKGQKIYEVIEDTMNLWFNQIYNSIPEAKRGSLIESLELLINAFIANECCNNNEEDGTNAMWPYPQGESS